MGWIIPCPFTTRLHPTLSEALGSGSALKEISQADDARSWAKLKIRMFLTLPYPEMWKIARAVHQLWFFSSQNVFSLTVCPFRDAWNFPESAITSGTPGKGQGLPVWQLTAVTHGCLGFGIRLTEHRYEYKQNQTISLLYLAAKVHSAIRG